MAQVRRTLLASTTLLALALVTALLVTPSPSVAAASASAEPVSCGDLTVEPGQARCYSTIQAPSTSGGIRSYAATTLPAAVSPQDIASMYNLPAIPDEVEVGTSPTVAVVEVGDVKVSGVSALADELDAYRQMYGLGTCSVANSCLSIVNQRGSTASLPSVVSGWDVETMLDVEGVSAACPRCKILVVEASSASDRDLMPALSYAASHASYVSMSWGFDDDGLTASDASAMESIFSAHPDVTFVASTGDSGWTTSISHGEVCGTSAVLTGGDSHSCTSYPASSPQVIAAGGTTAVATDSGWTQEVWGDTGQDAEANGGGSASGCSGWTDMPEAQQQNAQALAACGPDARGTADISALAADFALYYADSGGNWWVGGGTSLAAPILAALYARAGNNTSPFDIYTRANNDSDAFIDVTGGTATRGCDTSLDTLHLCSAGAGWDGPTGIGTPNGLDSLLALGATEPPDQVVDTTTTAAPSPTGTGSTTTTAAQQVAHSGKVKVKGKARVRAKLKAAYGTFEAGSTVTVTWLVNKKTVGHKKGLKVKKAWLKRKIRYVVTASAAGRTSISLTSPTVKVKR